ncbi:MAG: hypothetical protein QOD12_1605 [Verrucomicrobiota bacterium]|jgi:quercetin dioxygenase-like cupin family protein
MQRNLHLSVRFAALLALSVVCAVASRAQESADKAKIWSFGEMKWQADKALPDVQSVLLWGNPASGEHGMLRKFPAGYAPPMHKHPSVERVVIISGTIIVQYEGSDKKTLGPGSYSEIAAKTNHAVQCGSESACIFLLTSSGPFAILPSTSTAHQ